MKFKYGDRVVISDNSSNFYGCLGTVVSTRYRNSMSIEYGILVYGFKDPLYFIEDQLSGDYTEFENAIKSVYELETLVIKEKESNMLKGKIEKVIFNDPATIVFWKDGTKTVVKAGSKPVDISNDCWNEDRFDPEKGLAMAIAKKALGNEGNYYNEFRKWLPEEENISCCGHCDDCDDTDCQNTSDEDPISKLETFRDNSFA